jgi:hypothetical protein
MGGPPAAPAWPPAAAPAAARPGKPCARGSACHGAYTNHTTCPNVHPCRYGPQCRVAMDAQHAALYDHSHSLPNCPQGGTCKQLADPVHRETYHHNTRPDILIPCKHGAACTKKNESDHINNYKH